MKTIKQIADELGVSKQAVYKRVKGALHTVVAPYAHTVDGVLYIEEQGENLINQAFLGSASYKGAHTYAHTNHIQDAPNGAVVEVLLQQSEMLQRELEIKNEQIRELNARLAESNAALVSAQQSAQAAQLLHAGTMSRQLPAADGEPAAPIGAAAPPKRGFLSRFFGS